MRTSSVRLLGLFAATAALGFSACSDDGGESDGTGGAHAGAGATAGKPANGGSSVAEGGTTAHGGTASGGTTTVAGSGGSEIPKGGTPSDGGNSGGSPSNGGVTHAGGTHAGGTPPIGGAGGELAGSSGAAGAGAAAGSGLAGGGAGGANGGGPSHTGEAGTAGTAGEGGASNPPFPGCVHASYEVPVDTLSMSLGCSLITQGKGIRHVNVYYDASAGWLVDFPDSANAGPYALRQTATGYAAGSTSAPMGVPLVGWSVDCSTGLIQVSGISGDCINGGGSVQFSGQIQECALWVAPPGGLGRSFIGNTLNIQARGTCRENPSYRFTLTRPNLTTSVVQDWSPSDTFVWNTSSEMMGEYSFLVTVRSDGKPDESVTLPWRLIPPP